MTRYKVYSKYVYDTGSKYIGHGGQGGGSGGEVAGVFRGGTRLWELSYNQPTYLKITISFGFISSLQLPSKP